MSWILAVVAAVAAGVWHWWRTSHARAQGRAEQQRDQAAAAGLELERRRRAEVELAETRARALQDNASKTEARIGREPTPSEVDATLARIRRRPR